MKRESPLSRSSILILGGLGLLVAGVLWAGCVTRGVSTRTLENKPLVQCYERMGSEAEESRSAAEGGCPSCVY